jgi:hypothetical protein
MIFRLIFIAITTLAIVVSVFMGLGVESRVLAEHPGFGVLGRLDSCLTAFAPTLYFIVSFLGYEFWRRFRILRVIGIVAHAIVFSGIVWIFFTPAGDIAGFILFLYAIFLAVFVAAVRQRYYQQPNKSLQATAAAPASCD